MATRQWTVATEYDRILGHIHLPVLVMMTSSELNLVFCESGRYDKTYST